MGDFAERIRALAPRAGATRKQQARKMKISASQLAKVVGGHSLVSDRALKNICRALQADESECAELENLLVIERGSQMERKYIVTQNQSIGPMSKVAEKVPVYQVGAGRELAFDDGGNPLGVAEDYLTVPGLTDANAFGCTVRGDSMAPELIEGDIVVFSPALEQQSGKIHLVRTQDDSTIKRVYFEKAYLRLVARNPNYVERRIPRAEVVQLWRLYSVTKIVGREE